MSQTVRRRAARTEFVSDRLLTADERNNMYDWCGISDDVIKMEFGEGVDVDQIAERMTDEQFISHMELVVRTHRARKAKQKALAEGMSEEEAEREAQKAAENAQYYQDQKEQTAEDEDYEEQEEEVATH
jgi:hypothetical protein